MTKSMLCLIGLAFGCHLADASIVHSITDELPPSTPSQITLATEGVRGGAAAFRHATKANGEAAEFVIPAGVPGEERWYGWSTQVPADFDHQGRSTLVMQLAGNATAQPRPTQCPVATSSLEINAQGQVTFHLHAPAEDGGEAKCQAFPVARDVTPGKGKWYDFVLHAKWTNDSDGFVELWIKQQDNNFFQVVDYRGRTWAGGTHGPEFRIGANVAAREQSATAAEVVVLTDELRVGDADSAFDEVAPVGAAARGAEATRGHLRYVLYPSELNRQKIPVMVYTPPDYDPNAAKRYPVVYNLHGAGGGSPERQWARLHGTLTSAMDSETVPPMIYVFVNGLGDTGFVDHPARGGPKVFSSITNELIPFIDANYRTIADRSGRGVDGFSMGGGGAMMLATKRPDLFSAVVAYAGGFIPNNPDEPNERRRQLMAEFSPYALVQRQTDEIRANVRIRLVCGDQDSLHPVNLQFKAFLEGLNIPVSWLSIPGVAHDTKGLFDRVGVESLKFIHEGFAKN